MEDPHRQPFVPAFSARPSLATGMRPSRSPMDPPLFPEATVADADRQRIPMTNLYVRETTETSHRQTNARVSDPSMAPHLGYMPGEPSSGQAVRPPRDSIFVPMNMPSYVRETYHNMQAAMRRRQNIEAHRNRDRRSMQAAISALEQRGNTPTPTESDLPRRRPPPPPFRDGETVLQRQARLHPEAPEPTQYDGMEDTCSICLEPFEPRNVVMRLRCNHTFHQTCWGYHVRVYVTTQNGGWPDSRPEPSCAICRAPGIISSVFPWTPQFMDPLEAAAGASPRGSPPGCGAACTCLWSSFSCSLRRRTSAAASSGSMNCGVHGNTLLMIPGARHIAHVGSGLESGHPPFCVVT